MHVLGSLAVEPQVQVVQRVVVVLCNSHHTRVLVRCARILIRSGHALFCHHAIGMTGHLT